jgi:iron complex outermembrane recepter protein
MGATARAQLATIRGTVVDTTSRTPVEAASVAIAGVRSSLTRADGRFSLDVRAGSYTVRVTRIGYLPFTRAVDLAAGKVLDLDVPLTRTATSIDPVVSIGTRSAGRTATSSAVPVDVISHDEIERSGLGETWEVIQRLIPSVNVTRVPLNDDQVRAINLRGMTPDYVLVLVNGKRRHTTSIVQTGPVMFGTSPADINAIPTSAIDRIEVLREGASAQYGSDAIAGVVNIILKTGERSEAEASFGSTYSNEGGRSFQDGRHRSISVTEGKTRRGGAGFTVTAQLRDRLPTNRGYPDARPQYFPGDPRNGAPPRVSVQLGDAESRDASMIATGSYPIVPSIEAYAAAGVAQRRGTSGAGDYRPASSDNTVRALYPDGYLPRVVSDIRDFTGVIGSRGETLGWHWDLSSAIGGNSFHLDVENTNNVSLGEASPTRFHAGKLALAQWSNNLDVNRPILAGRIPMTAAAGLELRRDHYRIRAGEPDSWRDGGARIVDGPHDGRPAPVGSQGLLGFRPADEVSAWRTSTAAYVDLEGHPARTLLIGAAGRTEHFSDFGSTTNGRLTLRYEPVQGIAVRGVAGTGFRAPSLIQSYYSTTRVARIPGLAGDENPVVRTLPVSSPEAKLLGARPLVPEKSVNVSGGFVFTLPRLPVVTADVYVTDVARRIVMSGIFSDTTIARFFSEHGLRGVAGGNYFANAIDTRTRGLDIVATHGVMLGRSSLRFTGAYNRNETRVTHVIDVPPELSAYQSTLFDRGDSGTVQVAQPRSVVSLTTGFTGRRFSADVHNQRFGRITFISATSSDLDQTFGAKWITDLSASARLTRRFRLGATVSNLFDVYPDEWKDFDRGTAGVLSFGGTIRYAAGHSPYGINGRTIYVHLSYRGK